VTAIIQTQARTTGRQTTNLISSYRMALRLQNSLCTKMVVPNQMFPHRFRQDRCQSNRLNSRWWRSLQLKQGGIKDAWKCSTGCINMLSLGSICSLTEKYISRHIMGQYWAVACEYLVMNRGMAGEMNLSKRYLTLGEWEQLVQVHSWARLFPKAESQSGRKATNESKLLFIQ